MAPAGRVQLFLDNAIPCAVPVDLGGPEFLARTGHFEQGAVVTMPEAAMHEDSCPVLWENHVRFSWNIIRMQAITETLCMQGVPDLQFGFRVLCPDAGHHPAPGGLVDDVRQRPSLSDRPPSVFLRGYKEA
jgi:hypothetical protein